jgi:drug/metabolite transporter (DMT)-like permease
VGLIGGFGGVLLLFGPGVFSGHAAVDPAGMILLLTACVSWAAGSIYSRRAPLPKPHLMAVAAEMLAGGVILLIIGAALGEGAVLRLSDISTKSWLALAYLIFFGALIGFTAYTWLLQNTSVAITSTYAYINPVVAIALGAWLAAEPITSLTLAASALIIGSVVLITTQRKV